MDFAKTLNVVGLAADGFEISMYFYVKVHFQKNFISENKVHCVLNRARTLTIWVTINNDDLFCNAFPFENAHDFISG